GNPHLIPEQLEEGKIIDLLISYIQAQPIEEDISNLFEPLLMIVTESPDEQRHEMFRKGIISASIKHSENINTSVVLKAVIIITQMIQTGCSDVQNGQRNQYKDQLQIDGTLEKLINIYNNKKIENKEKISNVALAISFLFKADPLPAEYGINIIQLLKDCSQNTDEQLCILALQALTCLAECETNHDLILSGEYSKVIASHLKDQTKQKICLHSIYLAIVLYQKGSIENKNMLKGNISVKLGLKLSFSRNKYIAKAGKDLHSLLQV
ncbi:MAG: hypothetical protein EZS28_040633, partial [Streblomastix strix]